MRRWIVRLVVLALLVAGFLVLRATLFAPKPVPVSVVEVARGRVEQTVTNSRAGTVKARKRARLSPEIGGQAVEIPHREGEWVKAGEVILRLEDDVYRARVTLAQEDLAASRAERERACLAAERTQRELVRMRRLADDGIVSTDVLDQVGSNAETAEATCRAADAGASRAQAALLLARTELAKTVLRAPFDAVVAELSIEVGEWSTPSPPALPVPPVVDLIDPSSIYVSAPMDEVDSARIRAGQPARVSIDSYPDESFPGRVLRVAPYVLDEVEQNRTVEIEVTLDDSDFAATLLPGTSADVEVIREVREEVTRVPTGTLIEGDKLLVLELEETGNGAAPEGRRESEASSATAQAGPPQVPAGAQGTVRERRVELGLRNWDFTEISDGVTPGELVITSLDRPDVKDGAWAQIEKAEEEDGAPR